jgi:nucleoid DNA-binding protein
MKKLILALSALMLMATATFAVGTPVKVSNAANSINEQEAVNAIYVHLAGKYTKTTIDTILDAGHDLMVGALRQGKSIKVRGLGTVEVRTHGESTYKVPDVKNPGQFLTGRSPAGKHIGFIMSDLLDAQLNDPLAK